MQLADDGDVDEARIEALNSSLAGHGHDTEVVVRVDRSGPDAVANAARGQKATIAFVPADPPGFEVAVFGAEEDRLARLMPVPTVFVVLNAQPRRFLLALSAKDLRSRTPGLQVAFDLAARFAKAGRPITVYSPTPIPADRLTALGDPEVVFGQDRAAFVRAREIEGEAVIVPAPAGTSVFSDDVSDLTTLGGAGLLIAVGSTAEAIHVVTMGRNLAAGRSQSA